MVEKKVTPKSKVKKVKEEAPKEEPKRKVESWFGSSHAKKTS